MYREDEVIARRRFQIPETELQWNLKAIPALSQDRNAEVELAEEVRCYWRQSEIEQLQYISENLIWDLGISLKVVVDHYPPFL